ncbi:MAG: hypothetical protein ABI890_04240, partial [Lapillicoccus sp.]
GADLGIGHGENSCSGSSVVVVCVHEDDVAGRSSHSAGGTAVPPRLPQVLPRGRGRHTASLGRRR